MTTDLNERTAYIETSLDRALDMLQEPNIARALGSWATMFCRELESAAIAEVREGVIHLPDDYDYDKEPLPVAAMRPDDVLTVADIFDSQTAKQKKQILKLFESWKPIDASAEETYDEVVTYLGGRAMKPQVTMHNLTRAMTGNSVRIYSSELLGFFFANAPAEGLALVKNRPMLLLKMPPGEKYAGEDVVVHELVHCHQSQTSPILTLKSQRTADMAMLRGELEAYHVGAPLSLRLKKIRSKEETAKLDNSHTLVQITVEYVRRLHELDPKDPFKPSGFLWQKLQENHVSAIMHAGLNYGELKAMGEQYAAGLSG